MCSKYFPAIIFILSILLFSCGEGAKKDESTDDTYEVGISKMKNLTNNFLTVDDIQKISGLSGVKLESSDPLLGAVGDLNFFTSDNRPVVMVQILEKEKFDLVKQNLTSAKTKEVKELGDKALIGASIYNYNYPEDIIVFTKGNTCINLLVLINLDDRDGTKLSNKQMIDLAKIIESRMETKIY